MAIHNVFFGGDGRHNYERHSYIHDSSEQHAVRYEAVLLNRHIVLPFHFDMGKAGWRNYVSMEGPFEVGDTLRVLLVGRHALLKNLVFHNKATSGVRDDKGAITTPTKVEVQFIKGDGSKLDNTEMVEIDMSTAGTTIINPTGKVGDAGAVIDEQSVFTNEKVYVEVKLTDGTFKDSCFSIFLELVDMFDVRGCECIAEPCEVEYPPVECGPGMSRK